MREDLKACRLFWKGFILEKRKMKKMFCPIRESQRIKDYINEMNKGLRNVETYLS